MGIFTPQTEDPHLKRYADGTRFLADTREHTLEYMFEGQGPHGPYRHLVFSKGGSSIYRFGIMSFPGYLTITGDMGTLTFSRTPDMFALFRSPLGEELTINPSYWAEKVQAVDSDTKAVYAPTMTAFWRSVVEYVDDALKEARENRDAALEEVESEVISSEEDSATEIEGLRAGTREALRVWDARAAIWRQDFLEEVNNLDGQQHEDPVAMLRGLREAADDEDVDEEDDNPLTLNGLRSWFDDGLSEEPKTRYLWLCWAIVWGIRQYDILKSSPVAATP